MGCCGDILRCPGKTICCCCECACNMLIGIICSVFGLLVIIGLIVYFTVFFHKDNGTPEENAKMTEQLMQQAPESFRDYFKTLQ